MGQRTQGEGVVQLPKTPMTTGAGGTKTVPKEIEDYVTLPKK